MGESGVRSLQEASREDEIELGCATVGCEDSGDGSSNQSPEDQIGSLAVAITLVIVGLFLTFNPDFYGDRIITSFVRWAFVLFGIVGFFVSFDKNDMRSKWASDIVVGVICLSAAVAAHDYMPAPLNGVAATLISIFGVFGIVRGVLLLVYMNVKRVAAKVRHGGSRFSALAPGLELAAQLIALVVVLIQLALLFLS